MAFIPHPMRLGEIRPIPITAAGHQASESNAESKRVIGMLLGNRASL
jgi:hypothetical protein